MHMQPEFWNQRYRSSDTVYAATDDTYKASFATDVGAELQRAVNVQRVYVAARAGQPA